MKKALFKWTNHGLFLFIFVIFTFQFIWQIYNLNDVKWKKHRWCAWDSNPGRQDGRHRQIHWAMAAPEIKYLSTKAFVHSPNRTWWHLFWPEVVIGVSQSQVDIHHCHMISVTSKKSPNVYRCCPKWFHYKNEWFWHLYKNCLRINEIWANKLWTPAVNACPKSKKLPNLVTLHMICRRLDLQWSNITLRRRRPVPPFQLLWWVE